MVFISDVTIYVRVTNRCNSNCDFCYRDTINNKEISLEKVKIIIDKVAELGFKRIGFLGGEIFLRKDLDKIFEYAKKHKLEIIVASNGSLVKDKELKLLNKYVSWFGIPLDGSTNKKSKLIRDSYDQFGVTTSILTKFNQHNPNFKVRISTLVTKRNKDDLINIGKLLFESDKFYKPDGWRLLKFLRLSKGKKSAMKYYLSKKEFIANCKRTINTFSKRYNITYTNSNYLIIDSDYNLIISKEEKYIKKGDITKIKVEDIKKIIGQDILQKTSENSSWRR